MQRAYYYYGGRRVDKWDMREKLEIVEGLC